MQESIKTNTVNSKEWDIVQSVMNDLEDERFSEKKEDSLNFEKMKQLVAETYLQQKGIHLSPEKLNAMFKKYEQQDSFPVKVEHTQEPIETIPVEYEEVKKTTIQSLFKTFGYQQFALLCLGRYIRIKPNSKNLADHIPLNDEDVIEEVEKIIEKERTSLALIWMLGSIIFITSGFLYLTNRDSILMLILLLGLSIMATFGVFGGILYKNLRKLKRGLEDWKADWKNTNACSEMLKMISPLNETLYYSDKENLPDYTPLTKSEIKYFLTYSGDAKYKILSQWIKTSKTIRRYEIELLKHL